MIICALSMAAKIMSLYSITKGKVKSKRKIDSDLRFKMPQLFEFGRERAMGMFIGGASDNFVARHLNVHRTIA